MVEFSQNMNAKMPDPLIPSPVPAQMDVALPNNITEIMIEANLLLFINTAVGHTTIPEPTHL